MGSSRDAAAQTAAAHTGAADAGAAEASDEGARSGGARHEGGPGEGASSEDPSSQAAASPRSGAGRSGGRARKLARRARQSSAARMRDLGSQARQARSRMSDARAARSARNAPPVPHLCFVQSPRRPIPPLIMGDTVRVATYNVHRWQGVNGRSLPDVARAGYVIEELEADVIALQEVLRPFPEDPAVEDTLSQLCDELDLHLAFAVTRRHRRGQLGNAILSRFPITAISVLDISYSRIERRGALAAQVGSAGGGLGVVATHLSLVDRTRHRQVQSLLEHPALNSGPAILMGDMNAWRKCKGSQALDESLSESLHLHDNFRWPASFPAGRPMIALDRIYVRNADVVSISHHDTASARKASDHLPVVAEVKVKAEAKAEAEA
ncbi:MAG: endonuclease/exonuclease/phosphatase family protein, partial [bacterium]